METAPRCRALLTALILGAASAAGAEESARSALSPRHRVLIAAAADLAQAVGDRVWPGWQATPMELLLIAGEHELLIGSLRRPEGFAPLPPVEGLGTLASRPRVFPPTLLATMPLFGPPPTIVVGTPEATGKDDAAWLQVVLHEHFHQWQMRDPGYYEATAALDLADGDTTGRWMLEYPFPYDDPELGRGWAASSRALAALLRRPEGDDLGPAAAGLWAGLRRLSASLRPRDRRYLDFQLWQEGVARYVELRVAQEAVARWRPPAGWGEEIGSLDFAALASAAHADLLAELEAPDLADRRRVSFYAMGAGLALLADRTEAGWKSRYETDRFTLVPPLPLD